MDRHMRAEWREENRQEIDDDTGIEDREIGKEKRVGTEKGENGTRWTGESREEREARRVGDKWAKNRERNGRKTKGEDGGKDREEGDV